MCFLGVVYADAMHAPHDTRSVTRCYSMAKDEERRHERQAVHGYLGQANASIEHSNKREGGASATGVKNGGEKALVDEEAEAQAERELSNRPWGKGDLAQLQRAVDE